MVWTRHVEGIVGGVKAIILRMDWNVATMGTLSNIYIYICICNYNVAIWFEKTILETKPGLDNNFKMDRT
jgi:hypothetical protein